MSFLTGRRDPTDTSYLFVDGSYLQLAVEKFAAEVYGGTPIDLSYSAMSEPFTKVFYYDCLPSQQQGESDPDFKVRLEKKQSLFKHLRSLQGWHVHEGIVKRTGKRARQKEVDILIAVDLLTHTYRRNIRRATFLAGDQDFRPLVEAVVREGLFLELAFHPSSVSEELADAADARAPMDPYQILAWTTAAFQRDHPLPRRSYSYDPRHFGTPHIEQGVSALGTGAHLYRVDQEFVIHHPATDRPDMFLSLSHTDCAFLKTVHAKTYGSYSWSEA